MRKKNFVVLVSLMLIGCNKEPFISTLPSDTLNNINTTYGYNILNKLRGIWNGPVTSTTQLGNFTEWIVDFRPISENQISAKNELDPNNDIFMLFFIVKYNNQYKVAFRNGGSFIGMKRVSYFVADSVSETNTKSYYRFSEILKGKKRAYTEVIFENSRLTLKSYTNNYNTQTTATPHMTWIAELKDNTNYEQSVTTFGFPKNTFTLDFTNSFTNQTESIFYATSGIPTGDPYPETAHPHLGKTIVSYSFQDSFVPDSDKKVFLLITTKPLFLAGNYNAENLKYRSRYVILPANNSSFTFNYMHPGSYYYYALYDNDGNNIFSVGDKISTDNITFTLGSLGTTTAQTLINFTIP